MRRSGFMLLVFVLLAACKTVTTDTGVLSPAKLEPVILDLQLAEAYANTVNMQAPANAVNAQNDSFLVYRKAILSKHHISDEDYTNSMKWYAQHPEQLDTMYAHVNTKLNQLRDMKPAN